MTFILSDDGRDEDVATAFEKYHNYIESNKEKLPSLAYELATSDWYYDGKKSVWVPDILPWALFKVYRIDLSENQFWKGTITQIRLDPLAEEGGIEIDYIRLLDTTVLPTRTPSN